jgi:hypothetical protein
VAAKGRQAETEAAPVRYVAELIGGDTDNEKATGQPGGLCGTGAARVSGNRFGAIPVSSAAGGLSRGSQTLGTGLQPVDDRVSDAAFFGFAIKYSDHLLVIIDLLFVQRTPTSLVAHRDPVAPCFDQLNLRSNFLDVPALLVESARLGRNGGGDGRNSRLPLGGWLSCETRLP